MAGLKTSGYQRGGQKTMTRQDTFDIISRHLLTQNQKSQDDTGCLYRGPNGLKCAVGILIPDEHYTPFMENSCANTRPEDLSDTVEFPIGALLEELGHDADFCRILQQVHDNQRVESWPGVLRSVALVWGLSSAVVDELAPNKHELHDVIEDLRETTDLP